MKQGILIFLLLFSLQAEANEWQELLRIPDVTLGEFSHVTVVLYRCPIRMPDGRLSEIYAMSVIREDGSLISTELLTPKTENPLHLAKEEGTWRAIMKGARTPLQLSIQAELLQRMAIVELFYTPLIQNEPPPNIESEVYTLSLPSRDLNRESPLPSAHILLTLSDFKIGKFEHAAGTISLCHIELPGGGSAPVCLLNITEGSKDVVDFGYIRSLSANPETLTVNQILYFPTFQDRTGCSGTFSSREIYQEYLSALITSPGELTGSTETCFDTAQRLAHTAPQDFLSQLPTLQLSPMEEINLLQTVHEGLEEDLKNLFWTRLEDFINRAVKTDVVAALMGLHYVHAIINEIPNSLEWRETINALSQHPNRFIRREAFKILNRLAQLNLIGTEGEPRWSSPRIQEIMESLYKDLFQQGYSPLVESPNTNNRLHRPRAQLPQRNSIPQRRLLLRLADLSGTEVDTALQQVLIFDHSLRHHALTLLHQRSGLTSDSLPVILDLASSPYDAIRHAATHVLGDFSGLEVEQILLQRLDDANTVIVETALEALGRRPRSDAVLHALGSLIENLRERHDRAPTPGNRRMIQNVYTCLVALGVIPQPPTSPLPTPHVLVQEGNTLMPLSMAPEFFCIGDEIINVNAVMALLPQDPVWNADLCGMSSPQHVQRFLQESLQRTLLSLGISETVVSQILAPSTPLIEQMAQTSRLYSTPAARMAHWQLRLGGLLRLFAR